MSSSRHLAAVFTAAGSPLEIQDRPTLTPGPNDLISEVKSIALNPVDHMQRETGFHVSLNPAVLGSDIAGIVVASGMSLNVGARVAAFAAAFWIEGIPDYGGMQQRYCLRDARRCSSRQHQLQRSRIAPHVCVHSGMLVWGGASSIGSAAVQSAKAMGYSVHATASAKHHGYLESLGATRVFDCKAAGVEQQI
ncbi:chaperonin 10-like protein [Phyllosticta citricarpa]